VKGKRRKKKKEGGREEKTAVADHLSLLTKLSPALPLFSIHRGNRKEGIGGEGGKGKRREGGGKGKYGKGRPRTLAAPVLNHSSFLFLGLRHPSDRKEEGKRRRFGEIGKKEEGKNTDPRHPTPSGLFLHTSPFPPRVERRGNLGGGGEKGEEGEEDDRLRRISFCRRTGRKRKG